MITALLLSSMFSAIPANMGGNVLPISALSLEINSSSAFKDTQPAYIDCIMLLSELSVFG